VVAREWRIPPPELEYGLEYLGWSQWFVWQLEMLKLEADEREWRLRRERAERRR
jgi:hypothetical protein